MTIFDHFLIFLLLVVQPIGGWVNFRRYVQKARAGEPIDRPKLYLHTQIIEWLFLAVLLGGWFYLQRPLSDLGFVVSGGTGFWIVAILVLIAGVALSLSARSVRQLDQNARARHRASFGDLGHFLPQSDRDLKSFYGISVTAGIVEEIVFRGFVLWYLSLLMPLWWAVLASSVAFGFGHSYQGLGGMLRTGLAGLVLGIFYVVSGSIWLPIIAHVLLDWLQGLQIREIYRDAPDAAVA